MRKARVHIEKTNRRDCLQARGKKNCGSATIEMTLLMPIILGVFYLYISFFLFFIDSSNSMGDMVEALYIENVDGQTVVTQKNGSKSSVYVYEESGIHKKRLELHRFNGSAVDNIRRWQFATDTILSRGNP